MKRINSALLLLIFSLIFIACEEPKEECISDMETTILNTPENILSGNSIGIVYSFENIIDSTSLCTLSEEGNFSITAAYHEDYSEQFLDYEIFSTNTNNIHSFEKGERLQNIVPIPTNQGIGFYAIKIEIESSNDIHQENNSQTIIVEVN